MPVPHYDSKASVEADVDHRRSDEFMRQIDDGFFSKHVAVLVTCPYMENFFDFFVPHDGTLSDGRTGKIFRGPITGDGEWQMIALSDLGYFAKMMLEDQTTWGGRTLRVASDQLPMSQVASIFEEVTGLPAEFDSMTEQDFLASGLPQAHDPLNNMLIYRDGYIEPRDYDHLRKLNPRLRSFRDWLTETRWRGEPRAMRKDAATGE